MPINRRLLIQKASGLFILPSLPGLVRSHANAATDQSQHYLLHVFIPNGLDASYLFDARPRALTAAGKIQNYFLKVDPNYEPVIWTGSNGARTLASKIANEILGPFKDRFSILNGVIMSTDFDGHGQNQNFAITGNALGGESYLPHLNNVGMATPLDYVQIGLMSTEVTNSANSFAMESSAAAIRAAKAITSVHSGPAEQAATAILDQRLTALSSGRGEFSRGVNSMRDGLTGSVELGKALAGAMDVTPVEDELTNRLNTLGRYFMSGVTRSALLVVSENEAVDTHDAGSASKQPETYRRIIDSIAKIFDFLTNTPLRADPTKSLLDVTTVLVSSEFSRTLRQVNKPMDATGTDHNPLNNGILIAGKGIKPGLVIGASDLERLDANGNFIDVSDAHRSFDLGLYKAMGKPFDFSRSLALDTLPAVYDPHQYLTMSSVINTIYYAFGVDKKHYRAFDRGGTDIAPVVAGLLV